MFFVIRVYALCVDIALLCLYNARTASWILLRKTWAMQYFTSVTCREVVGKDVAVLICFATETAVSLGAETPLEVHLVV